MCETSHTTSLTKPPPLVRSQLLHHHIVGGSVVADHGEDLVLNAPTYQGLRQKLGEVITRVGGVRAVIVVSVSKILDV